MMPGGGGGSGWQTDELSEEGSDVIYVLSSVAVIDNTVSHTCLACLFLCLQTIHERRRAESLQQQCFERKHICRPSSSIVVVISDRVDCIHKQNPLSYYTLE
jgi:hypothetical protein